MNNNINLLNHRQRDVKPEEAPQVSILRVIAVSLLFLVGAVSIILFILIAISPLPQLRKQEQNFILTLSNYQQDVAKIVMINDRLQGINKVLKNRNTFDLTLSSLKSKMPPGVETTDLTMSKKNVVITVKSASLQLLDQYINQVTAAAGQNKEYAQVTLTDLYSTDTNMYFLTLHIITI